ncbi:MAG: response regulator transcription factor [Chloroflexi bacterium]|nr:response regulator transcription factor [Chloroflexota bacterium]
MNSKLIRVLLADDHRMLREGLCTLLERSGLVQVIGEAQDGQVAVEMAAQLQPDVVVMDIAMPKLNGIEATRLIRQQNPSTKVVILTMYQTEEYISEVLKAGAACYVTKDAAGEELLKAIQAAISGTVFLQPSVAATLVDQYLRIVTTGETEGGLTPREMEILQLLAKGMSNKALAAYLNLSVHTVRAHRTNIMQKLGVHNTAELINRAMALNLIEQ